jgi:site-specific DNA-cytosine methylase
MNNLKVLIACEYSGIVRDSFHKKGFNVTSCDILPSETKGNHYQGDIFDILYSKDWDLLIAFPPCTYISAAGLHLCNIDIHGNKAIDRIKKRNKAVEFFLDLYSAPIKHICIENPTGHISANILKPSQIVHPYFFGERQMKRTCLWLKNLPPLQHSKENTLFSVKTHSEKPKPLSIDKTTGKKRYFTDTIIKSKLKTAHARNKTFKSIANAMAEQWSSYILNQLEM